MDLKHVIIGAILFTTIFVGFGLFYYEMADTYGVTPDENFSQTFNQLNSTMQITQDISQDVYTAQTSTESSTTYMVSGSISAIRMIFSSFSLINAMIQETARVLRVPAWLVNSFIAIFLAAVVISIVYLILNARQGG